VSADVLRYNDDADNKLKKGQRIEYKNPVIKHQEEEEELYQKGFKNNAMGSIMILYMSIISMFWIIILLVLCLDYYGYVCTDTCRCIYLNYLIIDLIFDR
jgi:hypothetical protein